jgi:hypothetical protein
MLKGSHLSGIRRSNRVVQESYHDHTWVFHRTCARTSISMLNQPLSIDHPCYPITFVRSSNGPPSAPASLLLLGGHHHQPATARREGTDPRCHVSSQAAVTPPVSGVRALLPVLPCLKYCFPSPSLETVYHDSKSLCSAGKATHGAATEPVLSFFALKPNPPNHGPVVAGGCRSSGHQRLCASAPVPRLCLPLPHFQIVYHDSQTAGSSQVFRRESDA